MKTLVIYDGTGQTFSSPITGSYITPKGQLNYLEVEVPEGKLLKSIDTTVTPNVPIYEDIPLTEAELLKKRIDEQEAALVELASLLGGTV
jgi:hypothetical protein